MIVPFISLFALPPSGDDASAFLTISGIHPLIVAFTALLIIVVLVFLIYKRGLIAKIKEINCELPKTIRNTSKKATFIRLFIHLLLIVIIIVVGFNILMPKPVFETSLALSVTSKTEDMKLPFTVAKDKLYNMNLKLEAKGILTDVQIYKDDGTLVYQNICEWLTIKSSLKLEKGNYKFILTFLKDPSHMQEHFKSKGYMFDADIIKSFTELYSNNNSTLNYPVLFSVTIK